MLGAHQLKNSPTEKALGVPVNKKLTINQQCVLAAKANSFQGWGDPSPLLSTGEVRLECLVQSWAPQYKRDANMLDWVQWRATQAVTALKHCIKRSWELELLSLKWEGLVASYLCVSKYLVIGSEAVGASLCLVLPSDSTRGSGHKLKHVKLSLNIIISLLVVLLSF